MLVFGDPGWADRAHGWFKIPPGNEAMQALLHVNQLEGLGRAEAKQIRSMASVAGKLD